jgi:hypothetical protein
MGQRGEAGGMSEIPGYAVGENGLWLVLVALQGTALAVLGERADRGCRRVPCSHPRLQCPCAAPLWLPLQPCGAPRTDCMPTLTRALIICREWQVLRGL